ncbi:hypothetical protein VI03_18730 [Burkholderia vietnamiensis]|nr:hypothetical protein VI03_18730 [Burkholderia vietnamiensis]
MGPLAVIPEHFNVLVQFAGRIKQKYLVILRAVVVVDFQTFDEQALNGACGRCFECSRSRGRRVEVESLVAEIESTSHVERYQRR